MTQILAPGPFLAVDWGALSLRAWVLEPDGTVRDERRFPWGVNKLQPGEALGILGADIRPGLQAQSLPAILCGMAGSDLGMAKVAYADCPVDAQALAQRLHIVKGQNAPTAIVPGLRCARSSGDPDVMWGEETRVLGWLAADPARAVGARVVCLPGDHTRWVLVQDGRIDHFLTALSGEVFDVLSHYSILRSDDAADDAAAFAAGLVAGDGEDALAARLFAVRSRVAGGDMPAAKARSYMSGLLIGDEVSRMCRVFGLKEALPVALLGDAHRCDGYDSALKRLGVATERAEGDGPVLAGLHLLHGLGGAG